MKRDLNYITIDGRGEHDSFRDCVTKAIENLKDGEGIHVIKDFEPFPMYKMMESKGFDKYVEKISDTEYHGYFFPTEKLDVIKMGEFLKLDSTKISKIVQIKLDFLRGTTTLKEAKEKMNSSFDEITAEEFAMCEQYLQNYGISDDELAERMEEILEIFDDVLVSKDLDLPPGHPIRTYMDEADAIKKVLAQMEEMLKNKFIKNQWLEIYENLGQINIHFSRKQNQLFAALERKGFDKPSKVMWTLDNQIRDIIKKAHVLLKEDKDEEFIELQNEVIEMIKDMMVKEVEILFPTSMELLTDEDFIVMRKGDDEIGYCLIDSPGPYGNNDGKETLNNSESELLSDLEAVLNKHGILNKSSKDDVLDVSQGKLTLEQINLIFKHLQVDLSYVDENEIVKFYSDTKHRVFPRSPGVIDREVQNCHPRESVGTVEEIIRAFKSEEQDQAEFWLEMGDKFIYIIYNAVRDDEGRFRGVLEMMQDVTHIRSLQGSQRLLSWENKGKQEEKPTETVDNPYGVSKDTIIGNLVKEYPFVKDFLFNLSPKFSKLKNPILFKTMSSIATLEMIAQRGGMEVQELIGNIVKEIDRNN
ncbi:PAS domain-containing protein [Alkalicella caledoniensis]|uniref:PAS domain-containing protein n=1 Tax=Alkalicella caledoniensis TaxID=2731377 RepID=A0A7G9WBC8_ALKCA|nr:PAS domain-containing protein [Alkalicella caledoniensis]QNO15990.1 PAS domain-containing protein [Alkalicella caledoniensis]